MQKAQSFKNSKTKVRNLAKRHSKGRVFFKLSIENLLIE